MEISVVGMIPNFVGVDGWSGEPVQNKNEYRNSKNIKGVYIYSDRPDSTDVNWGSMALTLSDEVITYRTSWAKLAWNWTFREFWDDFIADGE